MSTTTSSSLATAALQFACDRQSAPKTEAKIKTTPKAKAKADPKAKATTEPEVKAKAVAKTNSKIDSALASTLRVRPQYADYTKSKCPATNKVIRDFNDLRLLGHGCVYQQDRHDRGPLPRGQNVVGSTPDKSGKYGFTSWLNFWRNYTGDDLPERCQFDQCAGSPDVGAHVYLVGVPKDSPVYFIVPACSSHNARTCIKDGEPGQGTANFRRNAKFVALTHYHEVEVKEEWHGECIIEDDAAFARVRPIFDEE